MLLSSLLDYKEAAGDVQGAALLKHIERNRFELSYATRLNSSVGLYFGLRP
jgi:hypothetical protein